MEFKQALEVLKQGVDVKRPHWSGFWRFTNGSIKMHCKDGRILDIRESEDILYTLDGILANDWEVATEDNSKLMAGEIITTFSFGEALRYLKLGKKVARKGLSDNRTYLIYVSGSDYYMLKNTDLLCGMDRLGWICLVSGHKNFGPWTPGPIDILADDWCLVN